MIRIDETAFAKVVEGMKQYSGDGVSEKRMREIIEGGIYQTWGGKDYDPLSETAQDVWQAYVKYAGLK